MTEVKIYIKSKSVFVLEGWYSETTTDLNKTKFLVLYKDREIKHGILARISVNKIEFIKYV